MLAEAKPVMGFKQVGNVNVLMLGDAGTLRAVMGLSSAVEWASQDVGKPWYAIQTLDKNLPPWNESVVPWLEILAQQTTTGLVLGGLIHIQKGQLGHQVAWIVCPNQKVQLWDSNGYRYPPKDPGAGMFRGFDLVAIHVLSVGHNPFVDASA